MAKYGNRPHILTFGTYFMGMKILFCMVRCGIFAHFYPFATTLLQKNRAL